LSTAFSTVEVYSPATNTWTTAVPMPTARTELGVTTGKDGRIYAIGGWSDIENGHILATVEAYSPPTNSWTTAAPMPTTRADMGVATGADGLIYVVGGTQDYMFSYRSTMAYSPTTNNWATLDYMPSSRTHLLSTT
jgi:N-acetylneuraminic acid mutarotase